MYFVVLCRDGDAGSAAREGVLAAHREYVDRYREQLVLSGPLLTEDGVTRCGQLFVLDLHDRDEVLAFVQGDPFVRAGVFVTVDVDGFRLVYRNGKRV